MTAETEAPKFQIVPFHQIVSLLEQKLATLCQLLPCKKYPREVPEQHHFVPTILDWPTFSQVSGGRASSNFCRFVRYRPFHRLDPFGRWSVVFSVGRCVFQRLPPTWFHLICHDYPLDRPRRRKALDLSWQACMCGKLCRRAISDYRRRSSTVAPSCLPPGPLPGCR